MVEIKRILCPIDFSDASRHALEHGAAMARWYDADFFALHVIFPQIGVLPPMFIVPSPPPPAFSERREAAEASMRRMLDELGIATWAPQLLFDEGQPAASILQHAATLPADLVVMGTHGLSGFDRLVLGSVAERVLRRAACPVMTVPPAAVTHARVPYTRLLCPVDFSEPSLAAAEFAFSLAQEADAHLTLLHVLDWTGNEGFLVEQYDPPDYRFKAATEARARLETLVAADARVWCKPALRVEEGKPYRRILDIARDEASDLIVIGVHGRNPVDLTLFGSTTNHVVRGATCPVLTLRR